MMRSILFTILVALCSTICCAQINLVHNPSFENYVSCPRLLDQAFLATHWRAIDSVINHIGSDSIGHFYCTPDYCNKCATSTAYDVKIPNGYRYHQYPHTGNGMMELYSYYNEVDSSLATKRDYLKGKLKATLTSGKEYCLTFYSVLCEGSAYATNHLGAYLDNGMIDTTTNCSRPQTDHIPQVVEASINSDTMNWKRIQGTFIANGTERFITIGNFFDAADTDTIRVHFSLAISLGNNIVNWYLIDDVSVIATDAIAWAGNDTTIDTAITDSAWVGNHDDYLPCKWYKNGVLIDSNIAGFNVHPSDSMATYVMELDVCGVLSYDTVVVRVQAVTAIKDIMAMQGVAIYPNPVRGELHITNLPAGNTQYRLLDVTGVTVKRGDITTNSASIDVAKYAAGVYVLELVNAGNRRVVRVVLQ